MNDMAYEVIASVVIATFIELFIRILDLIIQKIKLERR
jgi:hypothetical protein